MDSVDEIQKINNLARELVKHNIASNSDEALRKAEEMVKGKAEPNGLKTLEEGFNREIRSTNLRIDGVIQEVSGLRDGIVKIGDYIHELEVKIEKQRKQQCEAPQQAAAPEPSKEEPKKEEPKEEKKNGFSEKDVSIEKIFYYGKK
ncbi:MAG: hypothetical protein GY861_15805 [bacterium]|nr:hypothetical protein [bacterium]